MAFQKPHQKSKRVTVECGEGLTEQSHKQECDMNYILRQYHKTGLIRHAKEHQGKYDDVSSQDFQEAMFIVKSAENMFAELPSNIRKRFENNPASFLEFVQNPQNEAEMRTLGILRGNDGIDVTGAATGAPVPEPEVTPETPPA